MSARHLNCGCETCTAARRHQRAAAILNHVMNVGSAIFAIIKELARG